MSELVNYNCSPEYVSEEVSLTVRETSEISGKSIQTLYRAISLLKLSSEELSATVPEILNISGKSIMTLGIPSFEIARPRPSDTS
jgi:hypothetical protein